MVTGRTAGEIFESGRVSHFQTFDLQGIEPEHIAVTSVGRPGASITSPETRDL